MLDALADFFRAGGPVMYPIALASLIAWWLAFACFARTARALAGLKRACARRQPEPRGAAEESDPAHGARIASETARVGQRLQLIAVFVGVLPLLGLLGTVFGMIGTFGMIHAAGIGDPRLLAGGIRQALVATETGLATAIPVLIFHQVITARLRRIEGLEDLLRMARARARPAAPGGRP